MVGSHHLLQFSPLVPAGAEVGADDGVHGQVAPVQLAAHRGRAKGNSRAQHRDSGVAALPAVVLDIGVEDVHPRLALGPVAHKAQHRVQAAVQVLDRAFADILRRQAFVHRVAEVVQRLTIGLVGVAVDVTVQLPQQVLLHRIPRHSTSLRIHAQPTH